MKSKTIALIILGITFAFFPIFTIKFSFISGNTNKSAGYNDNNHLDNDDLKISAVSGKIHVDNNWTDTRDAGICTGNGIYSDPYVIEDLVIDGGDSGSCILIENSNVYFKIENCTLYNASQDSAGIKLQTVSNGLLINNNASNNNDLGISLNYSDNNIISGNVANNNGGLGIQLSYSNISTVSGNTANNNNYGIVITFSEGNNITGNIVNNNIYGMILAYGNNNIVSENTVNNNNQWGIYWGGDSNSIITGNTANNNFVGIYLEGGGKSILRENNAHNNDFGIYLLNSDNNNLIKNNSTNNHYGIRLDYSHHNTNTQNIIINNSWGGIYLQYSDYNKITRNNISHNRIGIYLFYSNYNYVINNDLNANEMDIQEYSSQGNIFEEEDIQLELVISIIMLIIAVLIISIIIKRGSPRHKEILTLITKTENNLKRSNKYVQEERKLIIEGGEEADSIIVVKGLRKYFGDVKAVNGISLEVREGELFGLLGPNGAGKTTTIKLLLSILEPDEGEIKIYGLNPEYDEFQIKCRVGYVSEEPLMFKSLTLKDLFDFIISTRRLEKVTTLKRIEDYLESFEMTGYYDHFISTLSHGISQKLKLIVAMLHEPDLLILDEPLSGLDPKSVKVIKTLLELHTQRGGSVLFSTHIMEIAHQLCDRIGIINKGKMVGIGTIEELRHQSESVGESLEDVFLRLTEQDSSVNEIVKKFR